MPDDLHRELKARVALAGMCVSDYPLQQLRRSLERPTREEGGEVALGAPPLTSDARLREVPDAPGDTGL